MRLTMRSARNAASRLPSPVTVPRASVLSRENPIPFAPATPGAWYSGPPTDRKRTSQQDCGRPIGLDACDRDVAAGGGLGRLPRVGRMAAVPAPLAAHLPVRRAAALGAAIRGVRRGHGAPAYRFDHVVSTAKEL